MPVPGASGYSASKAYVLNFSRALQASWSRPASPCRR